MGLRTTRCFSGPSIVSECLGNSLLSLYEQNSKKCRSGFLGGVARTQYLSGHTNIKSGCREGALRVELNSSTCLISKCHRSSFDVSLSNSKWQGDDSSPAETMV